MIPVIFQTKNFTLNTLWVFIAIAVVIGVYVIVKFSIKNSLKLQFLSDNSLKIVFWTLVSARLISILENFKYFFYDFNLHSLFQLFYIWDKGLSLWGGVAGFIGILYYLCKKHDQDFFRWLDIIIPSFILALSIGNLGAFFDGINYGNVTSLPWGVNFENSSVKYTIPIHPTQIYAFLYSGIIATVLIIMGQNRKIKELKPGITALSGIIVFGFFKFLEEFLRGDDTWLIFDIRVSQILTLIFTVVAGIILFYRYNRPIKK